MTAASLFVAVSNAHAGDPYDQAFVRARSFEARGALDAAARELETVSVSYPQDYAVAAQAAWYYARAGNFLKAEAMYREAVARAPLAMDARTGLAWTLMRQSKCNEAAVEWRAILKQDPNHGPARSNLSACRPRPPPEVPPSPFSILFATIAPSAHYYSYIAHPYKSWGAGASVGASAQTRNGLGAGALYRYTRFAGSGSGETPLALHEVYAHFAQERIGMGWGVHGGLLTLGSGTSRPSLHAGLSGRIHWYGDISLSCTLSEYEDLRVLRAEPSWRFDMGDGWAMIPAAGLARTNLESRATGMLSVTHDERSWGVWAGGKYGTEVRPAYLPQNIVYATPERILWGAWAGARARLAPWVELRLTYGLDRLGVHTPDGPQHAYLHSFVITPSLDM